MTEGTGGRILVVSPDAAMGARLYPYLTESGHTVDVVDEGEKAFNQLERRDYQALITPLEHRRVDGERLIHRARERNAEICIVLVVSRNEVDRATEAMAEGVYDFQQRPVNLHKLAAVLERGLAHQRLLLNHVALQHRLDSDFGLGRLLGNSRQMLRVFNAVRQAGPLQSSVLLLGEAGTGKSLLAQAMHNNSPRRDGPFVSVDCSLIGESAAEKMLFGAGGQFAAAKKGTLYLESVSELAPPVQHAVWEALGVGQFDRGDDIGAANAGIRVLSGDVPRLKRSVELGDFHRGLFEALSAVVVELPPLRHRVEDIPLLVQEFLSANPGPGGVIPQCAPTTMDCLMRYPWPENVSEMRQVVEGLGRSHAGSEPIGVGSLPAHIRQEAGGDHTAVNIAVGTTMKDAERMLIQATLAANDQNKKKCAKTLGIGLRTLYRKLDEYEGLGSAR